MKTKKLSWNDNSSHLSSATKASFHLGRHALNVYLSHKRAFLLFRVTLHLCMERATPMTTLSEKFLTTASIDASR